MIKSINNIKTLDFLAKEITAYVVTNIKEYKILEYTIVINIGTINAVVDYFPNKLIPPLSSTILKNVTIKDAEALLLIRTNYKENIDESYFKNIWDLLSDILTDFPKIPLWISPQIEVYDTYLDMCKLLNQKNKCNKKQHFSIKANFWFASSNTDCCIHNKHDFMEIHTQILGNGRMQKFEENKDSKIIEDILMCSGYTTSIPFCSFENDSNFNYPWHRYYADSNSIWLALEYHLKN